ncbi:MAG: transcriptional repressor [Clostridia bacterium]|nr:transcriptional repressor [Clostridia bacterium]
MDKIQYKTKQKTIIENAVRKMCQEHITVDSLVGTLNDMGEKVGRTTVYRCLERLADEGVVRKYVTAGESACYQYINGEKCQEHFHLKCEDCGRLIHIECDKMETLSMHISEHHGFCINKLKTVLYGLCEECAAK